MDKTSKIYVAGHTGLVGSALANTLREKGYRNLTLKTIDELDLTDQKATDSFFVREKPEYVFLAAAKVGGIAANNTLRADFIFHNLMIQNNVIHSAWKNGVKKLLFLGSTCIYPKNAPQPLKEDYLLTSQLEFTNEPYAIAKIAGLKLCESYNLQYNTNFISVMPTNLYGFGDNYDLEKSHVLPALLRKFHLGKCLEQNDWLSLMKDLDKHPIGSVTGKSEMKEVISVLEKNGIRLNDTLSDGSRPQGSGPDPVRKHVTVNVWGSGDPLREFMYSKDMAEACVFIMENIDIKDITEAHRKNISTPDYHAPHFLNIGTGEEISIRDLAKKIWDLVGFKGEILFDPSKPDGTMRKVTDVSLLRSFGFTPKVSLDEGLRETYWQYLI